MKGIFVLVNLAQFNLTVIFLTQVLTGFAAPVAVNIQTHVTTVLRCRFLTRGVIPTLDLLKQAVLELLMCWNM